MSASFRQLIDAGDIDGLVRVIDDLTSDRDWEQLFELRVAARAAASSGRQVWPAATLADYRLALRAPAALATRVLDDAGRFTIGPLTEVVAQDHTFAELAPHLTPGPIQAYVAHERAIRGEVIDHDIFPALDIPTNRAPWEPQYLLPTYRDSVVDVSSPEIPERLNAIAPRDVHSHDDPEVAEAFRLLIEPWTSSGSIEWNVQTANGGVESVLRNGRIVELSRDEALTWLTWIGASAGPDGRRRGNASGRFSTWWLLAALTDSLATWPPDETTSFDHLEWFWWDDGHARQGWSVGLAVCDRQSGRSWTFDTRDRSVA
mgnify:CR=1 FL=1